MSNVFDCWRTFIELADSGWFDFISLPYAAKKPMNLLDEDLIMQIPSHYKGRVIYS